MLLSFLGIIRPADAYSPLTHEQLIDLTWNSSIVPLLKSRYPYLTPAEIEHARAYAYGGCVIQDIGYYPFGDLFFSKLTHYVRSGDFVVNLFRNASNADELAFAIGALSHYIGDSIGHSEATNLAVPIEFPRLRDKYGFVVTYAEGEHQHVQSEFAFDVDEIAHHRFAPVHYLRYAGLEVPTKQLALAFYQTYGLREDFTSIRHRRMNVAGYRFSVHRFIPRIADALTILHRHDEPADVDNADLQQLTLEIAAVAQANNWSAYRRRAGIGTFVLAGFIRILPKVGKLKLLAIKGPTSETEVDYIHSVIVSTNELNRTLRRFTPPAASGTHANTPPSTPPTSKEIAAQPVPRQSRDPFHPLTNRDLDTGYPARPSSYSLTDETYATLLHRLTLTPANPIPPAYRATSSPTTPTLTSPSPPGRIPVPGRPSSRTSLPSAPCPPALSPNPIPPMATATTESPPPSSPPANPTVPEPPSQPPLENHPHLPAAEKMLNHRTARINTVPLRGIAHQNSPIYDLTRKDRERAPFSTLRRLF